MVNLNDIIQAAQGGQAVGNIASRFGLSPEQAQSAINALLPAFEMGMQKKIQSGDAGAVLSHLGGGGQQNAFNDAGAVQSGAATAHGTSILGSLFGGPTTVSDVARQAAAESGVSASVIQSMLPILASIIMSGVLHAAQSGAFGGTLSGILSSMLGHQGNLGAIFGQATAPTPQGQSPQGQSQQGQPTDDQGGLGGLIGSVLGGLFGGSSQPTPAPAAPAPATAEPGGSQAVLDDLSKMFQAGTPASPDHEARLASIVGG